MAERQHRAGGPKGLSLTGLVSGRQRPLIRGLLVLVVVAGAYLAGWLEIIESQLADARFGLLRRPATNEIVLVEIDSASLAELAVWPWPRAFHAHLVDTLTTSGATRIAFDIDFSAHSAAGPDAEFAAALARAEIPVILPVFQQSAHWGDEAALRVSAPLPEFARHVELASVNVIADAEGTVRRMTAGTDFGDVRLPALFALLAEAGPQSGRFYIDYGIEVDDVTRLSYADVLLGRFDPMQVAGRPVLVGATALELGDRVSVPVAASFPGPVVQMLAYESVVQGRMLQRTGAPLVLAVTLFCAVLFSRLFDTWSWRQGLLMLAGFGAAIVLGGMAAQAVMPVMVDVVPWLGVLGLSYAAAQAGRIDRQAMRLGLQRLALRRSSALVRKVFDDSFEGIVVLDRDGTIRSLNRGAERIFGQRARTLIDVDLRSLVEDDGSRPDQSIVALRGGPHVVALRRPDQNPATVELIVSETNIKGRPALMAFMRDITSQQWAEMDAELARRRLRESIDCIHEGFALFDGAGEMILCNARYRSYVESQRNPGGAGEPEGSGSGEIRLKDGTCLLVSRRPTQDGGTVAVYSDVTELKEREERLQEAVERADAANRAKTEFLANMCHELRTPLNAIIGFSETMTTEVFGPLGAPNYRDYAHDIHASGRHLLDLINDILDVSKVEAGEMRLSEEVLEPANVLNAALRLTDGRDDLGRHRVTSDIPADLPYLLADRRSVLQILLNLLSNAVKFTPEGGEILTSLRPLEDGALAIEIRDRGIGMSPEEIPQALSLFGQVNRGLERRYEGTGLGLPLSDRLMRLHGGSLSIDSEPGRGTTVTLRFPADRVIRPKAEATAELAAARAD